MGVIEKNKLTVHGVTSRGLQNWEIDVISKELQDIITVFYATRKHICVGAGGIESAKIPSVIEKAVAEKKLRPS